MNFPFSVNKSFSLWTIIFVFILIFVIAFKFNLWKTNRNLIDAPSYYAYLPATFIYHDLKLNFVDSNPEYFKNKIWFQQTSDGKKIIKHPVGISVMLIPFFLIAHCLALLMGYSADGYSLIYQNFVSFGVLLYLFIGLFYLRKILLEHFSEKISALTIISISLGTNLLWYSTFECLMPHAISFSLWCISLYHFFHWLKNEKQKSFYLFCLSFGLIVLIRPLAIIGIIYFLTFANFSKGGIKNLFDFLKTKTQQIIFGTIIFVFVFSIQLFYWKFITSKWLYDPYIDEHFIFSSPQMFLFLFSFRKGLFVYTPILLFSLIGLIIYFKKNKAFFYSTLFVMVIAVFIFSSWWAWSYGICWGMRPMIDYYAILSLPLAAGFQFFSKRKNIFSVLFFIVFSSLIILNLFQTWQYKNGLIHYDDMSKEAYFKGFFQTRVSDEWLDMHKPYDWERRKKGKSQIEYSTEFINSISENSPVYFRGNNLKFISASNHSDNVLTCFLPKISNEEMFYIHRLSGDTIVLKAYNGKYISVKPNEHFILVADAIEITATEKFVLKIIKEGDNKISLKSYRHKNISLFPQMPYFVQDSENEKEGSDIFRLYLNEQNID